MTIMAEVIAKATCVLILLGLFNALPVAVRAQQFGSRQQQQTQTDTFTTTSTPRLIPNLHSRQQLDGAPPVFASLAGPPRQNAMNSGRFGGADEETYRRIAMGGQQFGLDMFTILSDLLEREPVNRDVMISPYAVWSLLLLITEGAAGETLNQLRRTLRIDDSDQQTLRRAYRTITGYLTHNTSTVEVASFQALFYEINWPLQLDYERVITRDYATAKLEGVDFLDVNTTYKKINEAVRTATRGLIPYTVNPQDLKDANLFMMSVLYFKGQWKHRFNQSRTRTEMFFDEDGKPLRNVEMMTQEAAFNFVGINELQAHILELPYGKEDRLVMLIVLPRSGVKLNQVVHNLKQFGIPSIFTRLAEASVGYEEDDVEVIMPKFSTSTHLSIPAILDQMGIKDVFDPAVADLSRMSPSFYVSQIIHSTKIIVNEEGTEAAAVAGAVLINKSTPPKFHLNRPFLYMIIEKRTNVLLFAGQVVNPQ